MKENEMEIPEKLVEEIARHIRKEVLGWAEKDWIRIAGLPDHKHFAEGLIARIGKAILGGESKELDEALGVVGHRDLGASPYAPTEWAWWMIGKGARTFIAVRPQGTGKEEEK